MQQPLAERAVPHLEEPGVVLVDAVVGQVALHHDSIGVARRDVRDDPGVHHLGIRPRAVGDAERVELVGTRHVAAHGLAEVHVVGRREDAAQGAEIGKRRERDAGDLVVVPRGEAVQAHHATIREELGARRGHRDELAHRASVRGSEGRPKGQLWAQPL